MASGMSRHLLLSLGTLCSLFGMAGTSHAGPPLCDVALIGLEVDYDPRDRPVDAGPGRPGQQLDLIIRLRNDGILPIARVRLFITLENGPCAGQGPRTVSDFNEVDAGRQFLEFGEEFDARFLLPAGFATCCGPYTFTVASEGDLLECRDGEVPVFGDEDLSDDLILDFPDIDVNPLDQVTPDALVIDTLFGLTLDIPIQSRVIEDINTENLLIDIELLTSGPIPTTVTFRFDLVNSFDPSEIFVEDFIPPATRTLGNINAMRRITVSLRGFTSLPIASPVKVLIRVGRTNDADTCGIFLSDHAFIAD